MRLWVVSSQLRELGVSCTTPEGTFYAFPDFSVVSESSEQLSRRLLEEARVLTVPGVAFGKAGEGHLKLSFTPPLDQIQEAIRGIRRVLKRLM